MVHTDITRSHISERQLNVIVRTVPYYEQVKMCKMENCNMHVKQDHDAWSLCATVGLIKDVHESPE